MYMHKVCGNLYVNIAVKEHLGIKCIKCYAY